jgi:hypothetical protein
VNIVYPVKTGQKRKMNMLTKTEQDQKINLFKELQDLDLNTIQYRAIRLGLDHSGTKEDMIRRIVNLSGVQQNVSAPQAFALKTAHDVEAQEFVRAANARILPQDERGKVVRERMQSKAFKFLDKNGSIYEAECPFVVLSIATLDKILKKDWLHALDTQRELLVALQDTPTRFACHLIRRKTGTDGRFYLMLHVEMKPEDTKDR